MEFSLKPKTVLTTMLCIISVLAVMHIAQLVYYYHINDPNVFDFLEIVDFDYEANLPSIYSAFTIFICAFLLWCIGMKKRQDSAPFKYHWICLAIIFTFLGLDEAISIHEELGDIVEEMEIVDATGFLYFAWVAPYGILLLLFATTYFKFVFSLPRTTMILFISAGTLFISGAIGIEIFSAREADLHGTDTMLYSALYTVEELCEMIGIAIFCFSLLRYIESEYGKMSFRINSD